METAPKRKTLRWLCLVAFVGIIICGGVWVLFPSGKIATGDAGYRRAISCANTMVRVKFVMELSPHPLNSCLGRLYDRLDDRENKQLYALRTAGEVWEFFIAIPDDSVLTNFNRTSTPLNIARRCGLLVVPDTRYPPILLHYVSFHGDNGLLLLCRMQDKPAFQKAFGTNVFDMLDATITKYALQPKT